MSHARINGRESLATAFSRRVLGTLLLFSLGVTVLFAVLSERTWRQAARRSRVELARLISAGLIPANNGNLSGAVDRLRARYGPLLAVAVLDSSGGIRAVYPERPAHRRAVQELLRSASDGVSATGGVVVRDLESGEPIRVSGVVTTLNGSESPAAQRILILLREPGYRSEWLQATVLFGVVAVMLALLSAVALGRWMRRRVATPLRQLSRFARSARHATGDPSQDRINPPGEWRETAELADLLGDLLLGLRETEAQVHRMRQESKRQLRHCEMGFDRELRRAKDRATIDVLTRLRNRAFLTEKLDPLFQSQRAAGADLAVVMLDVDNFKRYNDANGHLAGDTLLRFVGSLLQTVLRQGDHAIRYGGDEFLLLLADTSADAARAVVTRVIKLFGQYTVRFGRDHGLSMSAGVASIRANLPRTGQDLLARADASLYAAKRAGKNTVIVCRDMGPTADSTVADGERA